MPLHPKAAVSARAALNAAVRLLNEIDSTDAEDINCLHCLEEAQHSAEVGVAYLKLSITQHCARGCKP